MKAHPNSAVNINVTDGGGSPDASCNFDFHKFTPTPATIVSFMAENSIIECSDKTSIVESTRTADNITFPIGISYGIDGTALQGEDYIRMNGFMIIPSNSPSQADTIFILENEYPEGPENIILTLGTNPLFTTTSTPQTIIISDCVTGLDEITREKIFTVFPNPTSAFIEIRFTDDYSGAIAVASETGQLMLSQRGQGKVSRINMQGLAKWMYIIDIQLKHKRHQRKLIIV